MPGMTITRLPYTDYYLMIRRARISEWQSGWENSNANCTTSNHALKSGGVPTTVVVNIRLS